MTDQRSGTGEQLGGADTRSTADEPMRDQVERLAAENRTLRRRVDRLESALAEIQAAFDGGADPTSDESPGRGDPLTRDDRDGRSHRPLLTSGGNPRKVVGKIDDAGGIGVYGHATDGKGTTYGVRGEVESGEGYGLYTPDAANVGTLEVDGDGTLQRTAGPVAKGWVAGDGTLVHGVNVDAVSWVSQYQRYEIDLSGESYAADEYVTSFDTVDGTAFDSGSGGASGEALLAVPTDGNPHAFGFVTHRLTSD